MSRQINLMITGLTMTASKRLVPQMDTVKFGQALDQSVDKLNGIPGLSYHRFDLDPESAPDKQDSIDVFKTLVCKGPSQGGSWDAHLIGAGLRALPELVPLLEELINTISAASQGGTRILFSKNGADHAEVVKRNFQDLDMSSSDPAEV